MNSSNIGYINSADYDVVVNKMREFCRGLGFIEVPTQSRLSILAACEDPSTISTFDYAGAKYPLPQTGQMWLEYELLSKPDVPGYYTVSTSYRNEPNPVAGRHSIIFPMFEFEFKGDMDALLDFEVKMLNHLGFNNSATTPTPYHQDDYDNVAGKYQTREIGHSEEMRLNADYGNVFFLKNFPVYTSPFWNMKLHDDKEHAKKIDVILHGMETIGSAERSCDRDEMRRLFETISEGGYAETLFGKFGESRVRAELDDFLNHRFIPRVGGGIGVTRMIRAMKLSKLM